MARIDYGTVDRKKIDRYLRPELEEAKLSDVIVPLVQAGLFFTKPGQALMGGAIKGVFGGAKGIGKVAGRGIRGIGSFAGNRAVKAGLSVGDKLVGGAPGRGLKAAAAMGVSGAGFITNAAEKGAKFAVKAGKRATNMAVGAGRFVQNNPTITGAAIVGAGLFGGLRAGLDKKPTLLKMDIGRGNPSLGRQYKQPGQGLSPGHLGATGDLTLNMHRGR